MAHPARACIIVDPGSHGPLNETIDYTTFRIRSGTQEEDRPACRIKEPIIACSEVEERCSAEEGRHVTRVRDACAGSHEQG